MDKPRILVLGTGAIGSLFAAYLSKTSDIYCVGRGEHIKEISKQGKIKVNVVFSGKIFETSIVHATNDISELKGQEFDYVFIATKAFDLYNAIRDLVANEITTKNIVLLQNGIGIVEEAEKALEGKKPCLLRALTYNGANIPKPGEVNHAGIGNTVIGSLKRGCREEALKLVEILNKSGLPSKYSDNIKKIEFEKLLVNATINPITAILGSKNGIIVDNKHALEITKKIIDEFITIANKERIKIDNPLNRVIEVAEKTRENISSMLQDIMRGKRTEIDFINGKIAELGKKYGIKTPYNELLYLLIKAIENSKTT